MNEKRKRGRPKKPDSELSNHGRWARIRRGNYIAAGICIDCHINAPDPEVQRCSDCRNKVNRSSSIIMNRKHDAKKNKMDSEIQI